MTSELLDDINKSSSTLGAVCNGKWKDNKFYEYTTNEKIECELENCRTRTLGCYKICEKEYPDDLEKCLKQCSLIYCICTDSSVFSEVENSACNQNHKNFCENMNCSVENLNSYCDEECKSDKQCEKFCKSVTPLLESMIKIKNNNTIEKYTPPKCNKNKNNYIISVLSFVTFLLLLILFFVIIFKN